MKHLSEEQIVLHCYGDAEDSSAVAQHLEQCAECRGRFDQVQELLQQIEPIEAPEPAAIFEEKTWLRLRDRLPQKHSRYLEWIFRPAGKWALGAVAVLLIAAAFVAGRLWPRPAGIAEKGAGNPQRVVLVAVGSHLERSQMLLVEIMNANPKDAVDLGSQQQEARDLLDSNHLYQVSAQSTGDSQVARLLDELGRALTEIANSPSQLTPSDLREIQGRIQSDGLLFKVRVVGSEVNSQLRRQQNTGANAQRL